MPSPAWEVELTISGPITVARSVSMRATKGEREPFMTPVNIRNMREGLELTVVARAETLAGANEAATYFVGQAIDILSLRTGLPFAINALRLSGRAEPNQVKRVISQREWQEAFSTGRAYGINRPTFSRALSWFRKGLVGENPVDQLIAFWAVFESIAAQFSEKNKQTEKGINNKICNCFDQLWGDVSRWKVIANDAGAVNSLAGLRNEIAHGARRVDVKDIKEIMDVMPRYQELARQFLLDWEQRGRDLGHQN